VARFNDGVQEISDLKPGMLLEGTVSNVAQFGAFVDLGVHQDGLIHVSQLAHRFVQDAREVVKTGQVVKVRVLEVDLPRKRISLTLKLDAPLPKPGQGDTSSRTARGNESTRVHRPAPSQASGPAQNAMAAAFAKLQRDPNR
jgi:uncharacterized protein